MSRFLADRFQSLDKYVPGEQPTGMDYIKLNTNESPYPPAPAVVAALTESELGRVNLYPDPQGKALREKLAEFYGVSPDNIIIGNGSDEPLAFAFLAFCTDGRGAAFPDITYGLYSVYSKLYEIKADVIPLRDDFTIDVSDYIGCGKNVIIANPNAPTGIALPLSDIESIVASNPDHVVLIDEAYVDFGAQSCCKLIDKYPNLLVVMTYSKSRNMAGARLGFALANAELIADLEKLKYAKNPYSVNSMTLRCAEAALSTGAQAYYENCHAKICEVREYTTAALQALGFSVLPSSANFIFAQKAGLDGRALYEALKARGVLVRYFSQPRISDYNRITIGTMEQMQTLVEAITQIMGGR